MRSNMTALQVQSALHKSDYVLFRFPSGHQIGINSKCIEMAKRKTGFNPNEITDFVSFKACSFHEYISKKVSFYQSNNTP